MGQIAERKKTLCQQVVAELQARRPNVKTHGFMAELRKRFGYMDDFESVERFIPDAYEFHEDLRVVTVIEVVDSNPITPAKAQRIYNLADLLPEADWQMTVAVLDNCGNLIEELPGFYFASFYIAKYIGPNCKDVVPAVRRVARELREAEPLPQVDDWTVITPPPGIKGHLPKRE